MCTKAITCELPMKLLLINPNTSAAMTASLGDAARAVAAPTTQVLAVNPDFGPASIEGHYDDVFGAAGVAQQVKLNPGHDAVVVACFGDPGVDAARELTTAPVLGIAEAAFHAASMLATGFSVVTTMTRTCVIAERLVQRHGFERSCRGIHGTDRHEDVADVAHGLDAAPRACRGCARSCGAAASRAGRCCGRTRPSRGCAPAP
jgi:Asp/Glu/hydantoin racemase